jgi:D-3-phosphoglycerate dehydrogenase / 2-oxoglutarate reductase
VSKPVVVLAMPLLHPAGKQIMSEYVEVRVAASEDNDDVLAVADGAVAVVARTPAHIDARVMDTVPTVAVLSSTGSGVDCIDIEAASARGIPVLNNPGVAPFQVAEYALGAMIVLLKQFRASEAALRAGGLRGFEPKQSFGGKDVAGKVLGIIGLGHIGRHVARCASVGYGMRVVAYDPVAPADAFTSTGSEQVDLDTLLTSSDVVTLHAPLNDATHHILGAAEFAQMKPGSYVVNASRGPLIDEPALIEALRGHLGGAALDVFEVEPIADDNPLLELDNVMLTPHVAGLTDESAEALSRAVAENVLTALACERPPRIVNPSAWPMRRLTEPLVPASALAQFR